MLSEDLKIFSCSFLTSILSNFLLIQTKGVCFRRKGHLWLDIDFPSMERMPVIINLCGPDSEISFWQEFENLVFRGKLTC